MEAKHSDRHLVPVAAPVSRVRGVLPPSSPAAESLADRVAATPSSVRCTSRAASTVSRPVACNNAIVADCKRCGQPVHEYQSHVMVVNVDEERTFFHAGCEPAISDKPDLVEDQIGRAR